MLRLLLLPSIVLAMAAPAVAQCPPLLAGTTAEVIKANEQRLLCLQRELAAETEQRQNQLEFDTLSRQLRELQTQQRFDDLDFDVPVYTPRY